jgi:hypothetical protein
MWFLMSFIPDAFLAWVVNTILIAGAVGFTASFFFGFVLRYLPSLAPYRMIIQIVSIVLLVAGVYFKGGYGVEMSWRERVRELEEKIKLAEAKSVQANEDLEKVRKEKVKVIRDTKVVVQEKIVKVAEKLDSECKVDPQAVKILNEAAGKK